MANSLNRQIYQIIASVPGIKQLATLDFKNKVLALGNSNYAKGFNFTSHGKYCDFNLAIILTRNTRTKVICKELNSSLSKLFVESKINCHKINIYIRGVN